MGYRKIITFLGICMMSGLFLAFNQTVAPKPYPLSEPLFFPPMPVSENPPTVEGVELGRFLFYDTILSRDFSTSCGSCHQQQFAFTDGPKRFSTGVSGEPLSRNTMPLFNLNWNRSFFWDGKAESLEEQVFHPVRAHNEMGLDWKAAEERIQSHPEYPSRFQKVFGDAPIDSNLIALAIAQFEQTLISHNSKYDRVLRGEDYFTEQEFRGFELMNDQTKGDCLHCHTTDANALGTTGLFSNNGLDALSEAGAFTDPGRGAISGASRDLGTFRIPSLRNVTLTAPYMHDGRFETLEEVLDFYNEGLQQSPTVDNKMAFVHRGGMQLQEEDLAAMLAFLHTLTDSVFIQDLRFSNPFIK